MVSRRCWLAFAVLVGCGSGVAPQEADEETGDTSGSTGAESSSTTTGSDDPGSGSTETGTGNEEPPPPHELEAGYVELAPVGFTLDGSAYTSSEARLFYAFQPADADADADEAPLFVFFNGGPGAATGILFGFNTANKTLDPGVVGDDGIAGNPHTWTTMGNCLWVDARLTGFSYGVMEDPSDATARTAEFGVHNFNPMLDAADFLRVLLHFYGEHASLRDNPVILVGESYGGVRATALLDLALFYTEHGDGTDAYQDPALVSALQEHYEQALGTEDGEVVPPEVVATLFTGQVLVQPLLAGDAQLAHSGELLNGEGSPLFALGDEVGQPFSPAPAGLSGVQKRQHALDFVASVGRDTSNINEAEGWTDAVITDVNAGLRTTALLGEHLGVAPTSIPELAADLRSGAYRVAAGPAPDYATDLPETLGTLQPWDIYYMSFVRDVFDAFYGNDVYGHGLHPTASTFGRRALRALLYVDTFITHGTADVVVWPPAIAPAFATYDEVDWSIAVDGEIRVQYAEGAFGAPSPGAYRVLRLQTYPDAAHSVTMTHPGQLLADVQDWL